MEIKEMMASIEIDRNLMDSLAVRVKGSYSMGFGWIKEPFKIDLNEYVADQKHDGFRSLS